VEVSRKPPRTAHPKPKNISCACHCTMEYERTGADTAPAYRSTHTTGRLRPDKKASAKNGRNPTSQSGQDDGGQNWYREDLFLLFAILKIGKKKTEIKV